MGPAAAGLWFCCLIPVSVADRGSEAVHSGGAGLLVPGAQKQQEAQHTRTFTFNQPIIDHIELN